MSTLTLQKHHDISGFAANDASRYTLSFIHYNADLKRIEATDGRMAILVPTECDLPDLVIRADVVKKAISNAGRNGEAMVLYADGKTSIQTISTSEKVTTEDLRSADGVVYPKFQSVVDGLPKGEPKATILLNPTLLKQFCMYAEKHAKTGSIKLMMRETSDPVKIEMTVEGQTVTGIQMPMK